MTARKPLSVDLIVALMTDYKKPDDLIGEEGLLTQLTKAFVERALNAEMTTISAIQSMRPSHTLRQYPELQESQNPQR